MDLLAAHADVQTCLLCMYLFMYVPLLFETLATPKSSTENIHIISIEGKPNKITQAGKLMKNTYIHTLKDPLTYIE